MCVCVEVGGRVGGGERTGKYMMTEKEGEGRGRRFPPTTFAFLSPI